MYQSLGKVQLWPLHYHQGFHFTLSKLNIAGQFVQSVDDVAEDARLASLCIMSRSSTISYCGRLNLWTREEERATSEGEHLNLWTREEERATSEGEHLNLWTREEERATSEGEHLNLWTREEERATSEGEQLNLWTREEERATSEGEHLNLWTREEERATSEGKQTEVFIAWLDHQHMLWDHLITVGTSVDAVRPIWLQLEHQRMLWDHLITVGPSADAVGPSDHSGTISGCCGTIWSQFEHPRLLWDPSDHGCKKRKKLCQAGQACNSSIRVILFQSSHCQQTCSAWLQELYISKWL